MGKSLPSDLRTYFPILHVSTFHIYITTVSNVTSSLTIFSLFYLRDEQRVFLVTSSSSVQAATSLFCPTLLLVQESFPHSFQSGTENKSSNAIPWLSVVLRAMQNVGEYRMQGFPQFSHSRLRHAQTLDNLQGRCLCIYWA